MSTLPERVWIHPTSHAVYSRVYEGPPSVPYVPESRLLAAEARVGEVEAAAKAAEARWNSPDAVLVTTQVLDDLTTLRADLKAAQELEQLHLQNLDAAYAERDALVPLARLGLGVVNGYDRPALDSLMFSLEILDLDEAESPELTTARAILDRLEKETG